MKPRDVKNYLLRPRMVKPLIPIIAGIGLAALCIFGAYHVGNLRASQAENERRLSNIEYYIVAQEIQRALIRDYIRKMPKNRLPERGLPRIEEW